MGGSRRPRVQFLVHGAELSGPPIYLLRLLRQWKSTEFPFDVEVVLAQPGPLLQAFHSTAKTRTARFDHRSPERVVQRGLDAANLGGPGAAVKAAATRLRVGSSRPDITVVNGATQPTADLLEVLAPRGEIVMIAHELSTGWFHNIDRDARAMLLDRVDRYLAVSFTVADFLIGQLDVDPSAVAVGRPPLRLERQSACCSPAHPSRSDAVRIGGGGVTDWRKAPDLWLRVAHQVLSLVPDRNRVEFTWIGGATAEDRSFWPLRHEIDHLGLSDHVRFVGELADPFGAHDQLDLFVSTAREDAYPLMCVEAAAAGIPVVSFDGGGAAELITESGCGAVITYPDERRMAAAIVELIEDPRRRRALGAAGRSFASDVLKPSVTARAIAEWITQDRPPLR